MKRRSQDASREEEPLQLLPLVTVGPAVAEPPSTRSRPGRPPRTRASRCPRAAGSTPRRRCRPGWARPGKPPRSPGARAKQRVPNRRCGHPEHEGDPPSRRREAPGRVQHRDQQGDRGHVRDPDPFGDPRGDVRTRDRAGRVDRGRTESTAERTPGPPSRPPPRGAPIRSGSTGPAIAIRTPATANADARISPHPLNPNADSGSGVPSTEDQEDEGGDAGSHDQPGEAPGESRGGPPFAPPAHAPTAGSRAPRAPTCGSSVREHPRPGVCWHPRRTPHARAVAGPRRRRSVGSTNEGGQR